MGVDNLSLIRWVKSFKTTRHPKEFKMRAAILLFALGVVAFVKGEAEEDPPTKEYENNHGKKSYGYKPQGYGYKTKTYGYKKHYGTKYDPNHVEATVKKVGEYAGAQEKYRWGSPTTVGSLYTGYGYGHHYP